MFFMQLFMQSPVLCIMLDLAEGCHLTAAHDHVSLIH